jgi:hypothetical protein
VTFIYSTINGQRLSAWLFRMQLNRRKGHGQKGLLEMQKCWAGCLCIRKFIISCLSVGNRKQRSQRGRQPILTDSNTNGYFGS